MHGPSILRGAGTEGHDIAGLWGVMLAMAAVVYLIVGGLVVYAIVRGRRAHRPPLIGRRVSDDGFVVGGGLVVPVLILLVLAVMTVRTTVNARAAVRTGVRVDVTGRRWFWDVR